jgi:predicted RNase H-like HicB family nuclease
MSTDDKLLTKAIELSTLAYLNQVSLDETTDGNPIYVARTLELAGCVSQGKTIDEAFNNLSQARIDYIYSLLEDGLPIPEPRKMINETKSINGDVIIFPTTSEEEKYIYNPKLVFISNV